MRATNAETLLPPAPDCPDLCDGPACRTLRDEGGAPGADPALRRLPKTGKNGAPVLLACGNALRQDDGVGLLIAEAVEQLFPASRLRIVAAQQWTPELAEDLAQAPLAIFVDASAADEAGFIRVRGLCSPESAGAGQSRSFRRAEAPVAETHRLEPAGLLALAEQVCGHAPERAFVVTVGAGSLHYGESVSASVRQAVPRAVRLVTNLVAAFAPPV